MRAFFLAVLLLTAPLLSGHAAPIPVRVCGGDSEWPPSSFFRRDQGVPTREVAGLSPEVLTRIFAGSGYMPVFTLQPWARCQRGVENGLIDIAMGGIYSAERAQRFFLSRAYFSLTPAYFYWKPAAPAGGIRIESADDLGRYRLCGMTGHNYAIYRQKDDRIDLGSGDYRAAVARLSHRRCDLFMENLEVVRGLAALGEPRLDDANLVGRAVPGLPQVPVHFMISRASQQGPALAAHIEEKLAAMEKSGELAGIAARYKAKS